MQILKVVQTLKEYGVNCSIVGGCAVALHGVIRGTIDLDLVIEHKLEQFISCEKALISLGYYSRLPVLAEDVYNFRSEYIEKRNLVAWSFYNPSNPIDVVDIIITHDLKKRKSVKIKIRNGSLSVLSVADLIKMKQEAGRPQDLEDIKMLRKIQSAKA
jgi:hypothetical protein